jgi:formate-dependent nitrite reductase membrane component NrfD
MGSMGYAGVILAIWFLLGVLAAVAAAWLVRRIWRRRNTTSLAVKLVTSLFAASVVVFALGTLVGLVKGFGAVGGESVDPSQKARILAEGIAEAMNCTALGLAVGILGIILAAVRARFRKR